MENLSKGSAARILDLRRFFGAPVADIRFAIEEVNTGEVVQVISDDITMPADVDVFCRYTGHHLVQSMTHRGDLIFWIRKK